jgi:hypothetical protein
MFGAAPAVLLGAAHRDDLPLVRFGAWPLGETRGNRFADTVGGNTATLTVPSWTIATHEHNRPGIVAGSDHALEISNGGPAAPMIAGYRRPAMSLVLYVEPRSRLRGRQYWNESDARYGREFIAHCDDGATPGSFAIERRRASATEWRLDGYVRDEAGVARRFSGGLGGIAGATLPIDTARRIILTQGPAGATLFLDDAQVAHLPAVTTGWSRLDTAITLGSSSHTGHANDRSPLWGRLDQIEVWQGQMALAAVRIRLRAVNARLWRYPADFEPATSKKISDFDSVQEAMNAAGAAGTYVYQDEADTTTYIMDHLYWQKGCRGLINARLKRTDERNTKFDYFIRIWDRDDRDPGMRDHGDPYAASGGYKMIGCTIDGNARGQDWHPVKRTPGFTFHGYDLQQAHLVFASSASGPLTLTVDACEFLDGTGDALPHEDNVHRTVRSARFYGVFRGSIVINAGPCSINMQRAEIFDDNGFGRTQGCGHDVEPFGVSPGDGKMMPLLFADVWVEGDFDTQAEGAGTSEDYYNVHQLKGILAIIPNGRSHDSPVSRWRMRYGTITYHRHTSKTKHWFKGMRSLDGAGAQFDHVVFIASGDGYFTDKGIIVPTRSDRFHIFHELSGNSGRTMTLTQCELRPRNLPSGTPASNVEFIDTEKRGDGLSIYIDGLKIDAAFADRPLDFGGMTVNYRNVLHERTRDTKPWINAGAEVPISGAD